MTTYTVTLDLTADELGDLLYALINFEVSEGTKVALNRVDQAEQDRIAKRTRSTRIVRQQLRAATINDNDGGPVGSCRYAIR